MLTHQCSSARSGLQIIKRSFSITQKYRQSNVLVLNCGSSSVKFQVKEVDMVVFLSSNGCIIQVLNPENEKIQLLGQADRLDSREAKLKFTWKGKDQNSKQLGKTNYMVLIDHMMLSSLFIYLSFSRMLWTKFLILLHKARLTMSVTEWFMAGNCSETWQRSQRSLLKISEELKVWPLLEI